MNDNHLSLILNHLYGLHSFTFSLTSYGISSTKEYVRKNNLFMQNKAKFRKVKLNVNKVLTKDYEQMDTWSIRTKQSQTNPNKAKLKKAEMNVTSILTVGYENKPPIRAPRKQSQTSKRQKPMQTSLPQRIMKYSAISASNKTNPNKPNLSRRSLWRSRNKPDPPALAVVNHLVRRVEIPFKSPVAFPKHIAILMTNGTRRRRPALQTLMDGFQSLIFTYGGLIDLPIRDKIITGGPSWENCGC